MLAVDLDRPLYYLGRALEGVLDVVTLEADAPGGATLAPVFRDAARARAWARRAPSGVRVLRAPAGDPRFRTELLAAFAAAGAHTLWLDPGAADAARGPLRPALDYLRSLRSASACL